MRRALLAGVMFLTATVLLGCERLPSDLGGEDVAEPIQFYGPQPRWIEWSWQSDAIVYELGGRLIVGRGEDLKDAVQITGTGRYSYPSWSPDGRWIVHAYKRDQFRQEDLWVRSSDASELPRQLTNSGARDYAPKWSADGRWIAFFSTRSPSNHVWIVPAEGGEPRPLARAWPNEDSLSWSPQGALLAYEGGEQVAGGIWLANPDTGQSWMLFDDIASERIPRWRPDGRAVGLINYADGRNVWVAETSGTGLARPVTSVGDVRSFDWVHQGRAIMLLTGDGTLLIQEARPEATPAVLREKVVGFRASPDGRRYVYVLQVDTYYRYYADRVPEEW
ncbi:MAG: hypothetical protein KatS3mg115_1614 [Candidatus Poribacteria bacterium]|nr:MAG: hypothetical protein KatS3mg115_1614 [Candidatus Poribacteria bacterium]